MGSRSQTRPGKPLNSCRSRALEGSLAKIYLCRMLIVRSTAWEPLMMSDALAKVTVCNQPLDVFISSISLSHHSRLLMYQLWFPAKDHLASSQKPAPFEKLSSFLCEEVLSNLLLSGIVLPNDIGDKEVLGVFFIGGVLMSDFVLCTRLPRYHAISSLQGWHSCLLLQKPRHC